MDERQPRLYLIAWGVTQAAMSCAVSDGQRYAEERSYVVDGVINSFSAAMEDGLFVRGAMRDFVRRDVHEQRAWWLVPAREIDTSADAGVALSHYYRLTGALPLGADRG